MRARNIFAWVCGVIMCCAVPAAFCQTLSGSLAAGTGLSPEGPLAGNGMGSISAGSEVSANANFTMNADFRANANANAGAVSGAVAHEGGAGAESARLNFRVGQRTDSERNLNKPVNGRLELGLERELAGMRSPESKRKEGFGSLSGRRNVRNGITQVERGKQVSRARNGSANNLAAAITRQPEASYSTDFPDSTKGTALLSPPDSTGSPLNWSPALDYAHFDFAEQQFLEPSLHRGYSAQKKRVAKPTKARKTGSIPSNALTYPDFSTLPGDTLRVRVPDPLADLLPR